MLRRSDTAFDWDKVGTHACRDSFESPAYTHIYADCLLQTYPYAGASTSTCSRHGGIRSSPRCYRQMEGCASKLNLHDVLVDRIEVLIKEVEPIIICNDHMIHVVDDVIFKLFTFVLGAINFVFDTVNGKYSFGIHNRILIRRGMCLLEGFSFFTPLFVNGLLFRLLGFYLIEITIQRLHGFQLGLGDISLSESVEHIVYEFRAGRDGDLSITVHLFLIVRDDT